uniref:Uncharacterized protein n=1 Tax=Octactis speculum TaxID=3111310 RepID=A0A7S2B3M5_9STRA|mmetsp:Transcript_19003/g.25775  ORF Transcript_19003/g.25775 Transcript_19003/m.25775 type:complete len:341 (+) Transcript_19003:27-1049(+)
MGAGGSGAGGGMNRMLVMIPIMMYAGKLDYKNEVILLRLRIAYFSAQAILLLCAAIMHFKIASEDSKTKIFVREKDVLNPAGGKYKETTYLAHAQAALASFAQQIVMGAAMTTFLHFKMNISQVLLMQSCMAPLTLFDSPIFKKYVLGSEGRVFNEKLEGEELDAVEEKVDDKETVTEAVEAEPADTCSVEAFKELISKTWNDGNAGDLEALVNQMSTTNMDAQSDSDLATALMVLAAGGKADLGEKRTKVIEKALAIGADVNVVDNDGWTALHWAAYHGRAEAAKAICSVENAKSLIEMTDSEKKTALDHAKEQKNQKCVDIINEAISSQSQEELHDID